MRMHIPILTGVYKRRINTARKMKFSIKDFCEIGHLLKKYLMENFIFCAV